jgi:hypothetical protein
LFSRRQASDSIRHWYAQDRAEHGWYVTTLDNVSVVVEGSGFRIDD